MNTSTVTVNQIILLKVEKTFSPMKANSLINYKEKAIMNALIKCARMKNLIFLHIIIVELLRKLSLI